MIICLSNVFSVFLSKLDRHSEITFLTKKHIFTRNDFLSLQKRRLQQAASRREMVLNKKMPARRF